MPLFITKYLTLGLVIALSLVSLYAGYMKYSYNSTKSELALLKANMATVAEAKQVEKVVIESTTDKVVGGVVDKHKKDTALFDRDKLIKELQNDKILNNYKLSAMRDRMQLESDRSSRTSGEVPLPTERTTSEWEHRYTNLIEACELTTIDYNSLHDAWDGACIVHGCK